MGSIGEEGQKVWLGIGLGKAIISFEVGDGFLGEIVPIYGFGKENGLGSGDVLWGN